MAAEPGTFDEAAERIHRAFCYPEHELVGVWDAEMAAALRRNGYAIVSTNGLPNFGVIEYDTHEEVLIETASGGAAAIIAENVSDWFGRLAQAVFGEVRLGR